MAFKVSNVNIIDDSRNLLNALDGSFTGIVTASRFVSNVAQGTAPISVASSTLVTDLNANFLNGFPGAYYQVANNLTGTAPASVITQSSGLVVSGNLNVSGNVSIGGTTTLVYAQQLQISDRDITLGVTTAPNGDDISTDITANHGGISIASTVGTPIIGIPTDAVNNSPSTYKQIMWIRQNHYSGFGTDAWLFNYGVSIGNTATVQNGSRLTVGAGFTVYDTYVDLQELRSRSQNTFNLNATGISTFTNARGTNLNFTGVGTIATLGSTVATLTNLGGTNLNYSGIGTIANARGTNLNYTGIGTIATLNSTVSTLTNLGGTNVNYTGIGTIATLGSTVATLTNLGGINLNYSGIGTIANISNTNINSSGIHTAAQYNVGATTILSTVSGQIRLSGIQTIDATTKAALERELAFAPNSFDDLLVTGISTFSNGPVLIGSGTSTGTASQPLQVTGGAYVSGSIGIGTTNPSTALGVNGTLTIGIAGNNVSISSTELFRPNSSFTMRGGGSQSERNSITLTNDSGIIIDGGSTETYGVELKGGGGPVKVTQGTFLVGTSATTGTASQPLQVTGGAYISASTGIGTTNPTRNLDVNGTVRIRGAIYDSNDSLGSNNFVLTSNGTNGWSWQSVTSTGAISGITITDDNTGIRYPLFTSATSGSVTGQFVDSNGLVYNTATNCLGIGSLTPTSRLDIIGDVRVVGIITATDFNSSSDKTLKHDIQVIENPIEKVLQLNGVRFNWNETGKPSVGVIAQEVEQVLPELVSNTDPKSVNYNGLIGLLIECVKDQQKQIDELKQITAKKTTRKPKNI
jgi:hypothetical protein